MKKGIKKIIERNMQLILYLLFGIITTVCSLLACYLTLKLGVAIWHDEKGEPTAFLDILGSTSQWIVGVLVSFFTNKKFVCTEAEHGMRASWRQMGIFAGSRVFTYFLEVGVNLGIILLLELLHYQAPVWNLIFFELELSARLWAKLVSSVVVVVTNYFISKLFVFRKKDEKSILKLEEP